MSKGSLYFVSHGEEIRVRLITGDVIYIPWIRLLHCNNAERSGDGRSTLLTRKQWLPPKSSETEDGIQRATNSFLPYGPT